MKTLRNIFAFALLGILYSTTAHSQEIGARFGGALGNKGSVALDAVFSVGKFSRVHSDVSFGNGIGIEALWDFIYRPISDSPINYYIGVGPSLYLGDPFLLGAAGEAGIEYRFDGAPIALGLDFRPTFIIVENTDFYGGFGFNVRYIFNKK
jgi:hypothetical protein